MYKLVLSKQADKTLHKLPYDLARRIKAKLVCLAEDPYVSNNNVMKLRERPGYRLRIGDWRIIYEIKDAELIILVVKIAPRGGVYR